MKLCEMADVAQKIVAPDPSYKIGQFMEIFVTLEIYYKIHDMILYAQRMEMLLRLKPCHSRQSS